MSKRNIHPDARAFVEGLLKEEDARRKQRIKHHMNEALQSGVRDFSEEDFMLYYCPLEQQEVYRNRIETSMQLAGTLPKEEVQTINHVFLNFERLVMQVIVDHYGVRQTNMVSRNLIPVMEELERITLLYQDRTIELIGSKTLQTQLFGQLPLLPGARQVLEALKKAGKSPISVKNALISYMVQDLTQCYLHCVTDCLRTDMLAFAQFSYNLAVLSEKVSEVLYDLSLKYDSI